MTSASAASGRYDRFAIALHWLLAVALLAQIGLGWYASDIPRGTPARGWFINLHKSVGITLAVLLVVRLAWRLRSGAPAWPATMSRLQVLAARTAHAALYACMLLLPLAGYLASNFSKHGIKYFNTVLLPPWGADLPQVYRFLTGLHVALSWVLVSLIALHVGAALLHLVRRDGVFARMLPQAAPPAPANAGPVLATELK
jgi:cytochrome b561